MPDPGNSWLVLRTDSAGNVFLVEDGLDEAAATSLVETLTARGHKQAYTAHACADRTERADLMARMRVRL